MIFTKFKNITFCISLLLLSFISTDVFSQLSDRKKAEVIVNEIAPNTIWANEDKINEFKIGVLGHASITSNLKKISKEAFINGKTISVITFKKVGDIRPVQILYVPFSQLPSIRAITEMLMDNILLITEKCPVAYYMINFRGKASSDNKYIDIEPGLAKKAGIRFEESFINNYGKEEDIKRLVGASLLKYSALQEKLAKQQQENAKKTKELELTNEENIKEEAENKRQKEISLQQAKEIEEQQAELAQQEAMLRKVEQKLMEKQDKLNVNKLELDKQRLKIQHLADSMQYISSQLDQQKSQIKHNEEIIQTKDTDIINRGDSIQFQRWSIAGFIIFLIAICILAYYILRASRSTKKINQELSQRNIDINNQKEEIFRQNEQTELLNKELEKLSIVAAQTDNAVTIMDADGNFEWINVGYTKMYGYTLQLLKNERGDNVLEISTEERIKEIFNRCKSEKQTIVYETLNKTRKGKDLWVQVGLTPILDGDGNISKLITVGIDINRMKEAENKLRAIHSKILEQSKELASTNKELEKLSLVARETDNAIAIMDIAGNYQWINEGFSRLFGYTYNQLVNEYSRNVINKDSTENIKELVKKCIEDGVSVTFEEYKTKRDKSKIWIHTTLTPIKDKENSLRSMISISQNIEDLKSSEQAILKLSHELEQQQVELLSKKEEAEKLNERIISSINYAQTIQSKILPEKANIDKHFESFILFKPKDIVSGDFYWHTTVPTNRGDNMKHIIVVADCTGHGVPGAFMSMIGHRLLNEIVKVRGITTPSTILIKLNELVKKVLRQEKNRNNDGMDVCICALENKVYDNKTIVTFAGAKRPLYYHEYEQNNLVYVKGTRSSIGGTQVHRNKQEFTDTKIILKEKDCVYLSTDGIIDQPAPDRTRFGSVRFKDEIDRIASKPIDVQKEELENTLQEYKQGAEQRDDITVIGVRIKG